MVFSRGQRDGADVQSSSEITQCIFSLRFCTWYIIANTVLGYEMNASCIKAIKSTYSAYRGSKTVRKKGMNEYLEAEKEASACEVAECIVGTAEEHSVRSLAGP